MLYSLMGISNQFKTSSLVNRQFLATTVTVALADGIQIHIWHISPRASRTDLVGRTSPRTTWSFLGLGHKALIRFSLGSHTAFDCTQIIIKAI